MKLSDNEKRINKARFEPEKDQNQGISQGDLATALSVDRAYISNIENGKTNPTLSTITNIAKALGVSSDELLK